ncbi:MAG: cupin domain-containing protein [Pirellulaceae bacterium]|nr:cupin domain-containing protein [Pirellulaceae bacterium]
MPVANWKTQSFNVIQSLLYNNPDRVIQYKVRDTDGNWVDRSSQPAPVRRLYETEASDERTCLRTIQFVHHVLIPPGARHVQELHIHPDAEELVVITEGQGTIDLDGSITNVNSGDVIYIPPDAEHQLSNTGNDFLGALFINVPTGSGLDQLKKTQES